MNITQIVALVVIVILAIIYLAWKIYKQGLRQVAIDLILEAEKTLDNNEEKFKMVVGGIIAKLPFPFNFIPESVIRKLVQATFDSIKAVLDYRGEEN